MSRHNTSPLHLVPALCRLVVALSLLGLCSGPLLASPEVTRTPSGRSISLEVLIDGTPSEVFEAWVTPESVADFFGSDARIEALEGGLYEIRFGLRPDGGVAGTRHNRILRYEPPAALDFEWVMPFFAEELNTDPLPTWVEIRFLPFGDGTRTRVQFAHHGFGEGALWDECFAFFQRGWFDVLFRLRLHREYFTWGAAR